MLLPMRRAQFVFLVLIAVSALFSLMLLLGRPAPEEPWCKDCDVVLISFESVGMQEAALNTVETPMPQLAAFAKARGILFTRAYAQAPWSLPSHASLLTGLYPWTLGIWDGVDAVPPSTPTLASALSRQGYDTRMYSDGFVRPEFGFGQGFSYSHGTLETSEASAEMLFDEAAKVLAEPSEVSRLLFIHPDRVRLPYGDNDARMLAALHAQESGPTREDAAGLRQSYLRELTELDETFGRFIDSLEKSGALDRTIIVITSGNGTRFLKEGELGLSQSSLSDESLRVPLLFSVPGKAAAHVDATIETRAVPATILQMVGAASAGIPGESLVPLMEGTGGNRLVKAATAKDQGSALQGLLETDSALRRIASGDERPRARITPFSEPHARMALRGTWKVTIDQDGTRHIRNLAEDPGERRDYMNALPPPPIEMIDELVAALLRL